MYLNVFARILKQYSVSGEKIKICLNPITSFLKNCVNHRYLGLSKGSQSGQNERNYSFAKCLFPVKERRKKV